MTKQHVETRVEGTDAEVQAAQDAAGSMATFLDLLIAGAEKQPGLAERTAKLMRDFQSGEANVRAEVTLARDGVIAFEFFALRADRPPQAIFDVVPSRQLDS